VRFDVDWLTGHLGGAADRDLLAERLTACGFLVELRDRADAAEAWEVEVTTNRPDALSHRGLAREAAVAMRVPLKPVQIELDESDEPAAELAAVTITAPQLCSRYVARVVRGVRIGPSPDWLQRKLERCGVRPINAVVDATNWVLLDLGQPLHAFDLAKLAGRRIVVRRAAAGETLVTLDGESRELTTDDLVIADAARAVALAGIMGGADSEIGADTSDVLIESAHFEPLAVRRTARRIGMHTEASHRFERGADPELAPVACDAVAAMIARLTGGRVCRGRIDVCPRPIERRRLAFSAAALSAFAGLEIAAGDARRILVGLGFEPTGDGDLVTVTVPSHRVDVERAADLYEEVIRHVGYGAVPAVLPVLPTPPGHRHTNWELVDRGRDAAVAAGLNEVMTWSFIDPGDDALADELPLCPGRPLGLANPISGNQSTMRRSLLPGLLAAARDNLNRGERSLALFEQGRVFGVADGGTVEGERLAIVMSGAAAGQAITFAELKGAVEGVLDRAQFPAVRWQRGGAPFLDEAEGALVSADGGRVVGCAGLLARRLEDRYGLRQAVYLAELDLGAVLVAAPLARFRPLPRFPSVVADMTVEHPQLLAYADLEEAVRALASELVEAVELQARFQGGDLPAAVVRTTLRLTYRHRDRSLTQDEVNAEQVRLRERLAERLKVRFA
jgi:phenylalanyl-tRNA synthetase beta chain